MKLGEIVRFELAYQVRRVSAWLCFAVLFVGAFAMMAGSRPTEDEQFLFSPYSIAFFTVLGGAVWLLIAASVAGEAAVRDVQTRMHPLTYSAPVSKAEYLGGRFLAAFVLNALILLAVPAGILLARVLSEVEPARLGPFRPAVYVAAYGLIALPLAFAATAIQFASAALSRRAMASYLASVLLFITCTVVLLIVAHLSGWWELVSLLDLVGIGAIVNHLGDTWTAAEKNTRLVGTESALLVNRLIWLTVAAGVLAFTYLRFRLGHPAERTRRRGSAPGGDIARSAPIAVPRVGQAFGLGMYARQTAAIAWASFRAIAKSPGGLGLLAFIAAMLVVFLPQNLELFGVPLRPRTGFLLTFLTAPLSNPYSPWVFVPLLIVLYASELAWREREAGLGDITGAAPVPEWALLLGKFLGLGLVLAAWMALLALAGMLIQARMGCYDFEMGLYLRVLFGLQLPEYLLFALLALVVQATIDQRYVGILVTLIAYACIAFASTLGIENDLFVYGAGPGWSYSEMRGFGASLGPWLWFKLYWAAWALLLAVLARLLWVRGRDEGIGARIRLARRRFTRPTAWAAAVAAALIVGLGGFIFYNTNQYDTASERAERLAEYERRYGRYERIPQPRLAGTNLRVEIHPERREAEIRGTYHLVNRGAAPIDSIHVATVPGVETGAMTFDRPAARVLADEDLGHRIYALAQPLQPGDSLRLSFRVRVASRGLSNGADASVAANGTFFTSEAWLPAIGYQADRELRADRRAHGLAPRPIFRSLQDADARQDSAAEDRVAFDAVVGTSADQVAVAPGAPRGTWMEGGRRYFRYSADLIRGELAFFSANYAVREGRWRDVAIRIYHHPGHTANLDRMLRSVRASLDHYTARYGPNPHRHISLVETPGMGGMHAYASLITFQEAYPLFHVEGDAPDFPFSVAAHEVAHQWWGSHLAPARVEGNPLLSESLAEYSAFRVLKQTYDEEHLRRYLRQLRTRYEVPGKRDALPLLRANDEFHQYYKGPLAMYALSEYIGEERVDHALRRLQEAHGSGALLTSLDLYRELQAVTPDSLRYLLHDLFAANTAWELATERATATQTAAGTWQVTLDVRARKTVPGPAGAETDVPMNDWVEIGVFAGGKPLYLQKHRIRSGAQRITVAVPARPARAGIDPRHLLFDSEVGDNLEEIED
ncbi:MAG TPA: M1 family aminopeptidase [Longimicrobium sp.]